MEFRVLGPIEVRDGGRCVDLGGRKQRTILALLVANAGHSITTDRLVDWTYGEDAGDGARHSVQTYVSNLRGQLGDIIVSSGHAYKLRLDDSTVDSIEFAKQVQDAQALLSEDCEAAARHMRAALEMWRGRPFQDVDGGRDLDLHATQLDALRMEALETRIDADLACGQHRALIGELEALTTEHPFRETFHSQLMLALYRSGRQAEALRAYQRIRRNLAEELGIDASPELRQLEQRILEQSPDLSLDPPSPKPASPRPPPAQVSQPTRVSADTPHPPALHLEDVDELEEIAPVLYMTSNDRISNVAADTDAAVDEGGDMTSPLGEPVPSPKGSSVARLALLVGLVGLAAVLGAVLYANLSRGTDTATPATNPTITTMVATSPPEPTPTPPLTTTAPPETTTVPESSPALSPSTETIQAGSGPQILFADESAVWATLIGEAAILRIDPTTLKKDKVPVGDNPTRPLDLNGRLWVPSREGGLLVVVDKTSLKAVGWISVGERLDTPVSANDLVWVTAREDFKLVAIDPETFEIVEELRLSGFPLTPVLANDGLWVVGRDSGEVTRVDPVTLITDLVTTLGKGAHPPILVGNEIWIVNRNDGTVTIIDTFTRAKEVVFPIDGKLSPPVLMDGRVWISDTEFPKLIPIDTARRKEGVPIYTGRQVTSPTVYQGAFWAVDPNEGVVVRIDPDTRATLEIRVDGRPGVPLSAHGYLWVPDVSGTTITRISE